MASVEIRVPDIGDFKDVPIIEIHVAPGASVSADAPLITLESDKASMDIPSPAAGTISQLLVKLGDRVSEGHPVLKLRTGQTAAPPGRATVAMTPPAPAPRPPSAAKGDLHAEVLV